MYNLQTKFEGIKILFGLVWCFGIRSFALFFATNSRIGASLFFLGQEVTSKPKEHLSIEYDSYQLLTIQEFINAVIER